jgi:hypothetical protein
MDGNSTFVEHTYHKFSDLLVWTRPTNDMGFLIDLLMVAGPVAAYGPQYKMILETKEAGGFDSRGR